MSEGREEGGKSQRMEGGREVGGTSEGREEKGERGEAGEGGRTRKEGGREKREVAHSLCTLPVEGRGQCMG